MTITLLELLARYTPVQNSVLRHLEIREVISLTKTTKAFADFTKIVERTQFNINDWLKPFFDPISFRSLQAKHNIFIGSTFAYKIVARTTPAIYRNGTALDGIFVEEGSHETALIEFVVEQGYREVEPPPEGNPADEKVCPPTFAL